MKNVGVFYQREGSADIEHIEIPAEQTVADLLAAIHAKHGGDPDVVIFAEDAEEPLAPTTAISAIAGTRGARVHVHKCRKIAVSVHFTDKTFERHFAPGTTVARVKHWAARDELHMSEEEASEHVLQLAGTTERPRPNTHIGALASCPGCRVAFDLIPAQRVNGASP
jgi:hypothetical protein